MSGNAQGIEDAGGGLDTYERFVQRERHLRRLEGEVRSLDRLTISRLVRGGDFTIETPGMDGHFLCAPFASGARLVFMQERYRQEGILEPGQMTVLPAGRPAHWTAQTPPVVNTVNVIIHPSLFAEALGHKSVELPRMPWFSDPYIQRLIGMMADEVSAGCPEGTLFLESLVRPLALRIAWACAEIAPKADSPKRGRAEIRRIIEILHSDPGGDHSLKSLAAVTCLSPHHLGRVFKRETGESVHACLVRLRVERAASLLQGGEQPASEIAVACGFYDESHLSRHVKRLTGSTIKALRRK